VETSELSIQEFTEKALSMASKDKVTAGERRLLVPMLSGIALSTFESKKEQEYWIALVGVESGYDQRVKSPVGATGLGQLMPQFYKDIALSCGIENLAPDTINDRYINALLSACYFKSLIQKSDGIISLALVAYNAGINSSSFQKAKNGGVPVTETAGYVTKVQISKEKTMKP
jgi:soluble lytic murein transglycosylase-like protein